MSTNCSTHNRAKKRERAASFGLGGKLRGLHVRQLPIIGKLGFKVGELIKPFLQSFRSLGAHLGRADPFLNLREFDLLEELVFLGSGVIRRLSIRLCLALTSSGPLKQSVPESSKVDGANR